MTEFSPDRDARADRDAGSQPDPVFYDDRERIHPPVLPHNMMQRVPGIYERHIRPDRTSEPIVIPRSSTRFRFELM